MRHFLPFLTPFYCFNLYFLGCLTRWSHFGSVLVNDVLVTSYDTSRDSKLYQSVYKGLNIIWNILWSKFHWCSVRGSWNIKGDTKASPPPPWIHRPKKPMVNRVKIGHFTKENIFVKKSWVIKNRLAGGITTFWYYLKI